MFLTKAGEIKLGDLNVAKVADSTFQHTQTGTPYYASPEVWSDSPYDERSDVWSLGVLLYELTCLKLPFESSSMTELYEEIKLGSY